MRKRDVLWALTALLITGFALAANRYAFECHPPTQRRPGAELGDCYVLDRWTGEVRREARP